MTLKIPLEEEVTEALGRDFYERSSAAKGHSNGCKERTIKLSCGDISIPMPKVRGLVEVVHSRVVPPYHTRMEEIEEVIPLLYMNGLSTRKVKRSLKKVFGKKGLSHQPVSNITGKVVEEFNEWKKRALSGLSVLYLVVDGIRIGVRAGTSEKEAVLVATVFLEGGRREPLSVALGNGESYLSWNGFLEHLRRGALGDPLLMSISGCPGLIGAVVEIFSGVRMQRCTKHRMEMFWRRY